MSSSASRAWMTSGRPVCARGGDMRAKDAARRDRAACRRNDNRGPPRRCRRIFRIAPARRGLRPKPVRHCAFIGCVPTVQIDIVIGFRERADLGEFRDPRRDGDHALDARRRGRARRHRRARRRIRENRDGNASRSASVGLAAGCPVRHNAEKSAKVQAARVPARPCRPAARSAKSRCSGATASRSSSSLSSPAA